MGQLDRHIDDNLPSPRALAHASKVVIQAEDGRDMPFKDLFPRDSDVKTILIFIRHFRCELCQSFLTYLTLSDIITPEVLAANNARLVVVGCGEWKMIKSYKNLMNLPFEVYANPSASLYDILGMGHEKGLHTDITSHYTSGTFLAMVRRAFFKALRMGHLFGKAGVQSQLGGEFIFTRRSDEDVLECSFSHRMKSIVDHAESSTLLSAVTKEHPDTTSSGDSDSFRSEGDEDEEYEEYMTAYSASVRRASVFSFKSRRQSMATMIEAEA